MCVCVSPPSLGLRFLVRLCTDMGLKEVQEYATKLKKVEKMKEIREQVLTLQAFPPTCTIISLGHSDKTVNLKPQT